MSRFVRSHAITVAAVLFSAVLVVGAPVLAQRPPPAAPGSWRITGNTGTDPAINFLGTTDNQPLNLRVNDVRGWQLQPTAGTPNIVGGFSGNSASPGVEGATIGGGGTASSPNSVTDPFGTVGGGTNNHAFDEWATVAGGRNNFASGEIATVAGGGGNIAFDIATVGGGGGNSARGFGATVPGGISNAADGDVSFAAGRLANADHPGTFVWADSTFAPMASTGSNQFIVRASGGLFLQNDSTLDDQGGFINTSTGAFLSNAGVWTDFSSREVKENFAPVDSQEVLDRVAFLPITSWNYEAQDPSIRHIGPVAEDFHATFGVGEDPQHLASLDTGGVALAAIQGLNRKVEDLQARLSGGPTVGAPQAGGLWSILPAVGMLGLALGIALVGRRTLGGVWASR